MMDPLRSAMNIFNEDDTSLALPSDNKLRSGQQRVLEQVGTIKRSKSKHGKNGSMSPPATSSSQQDSVFAEFGSFKYAPSKAKDTFSRSKSLMSTGISKTVFVQLSSEDSHSIHESHGKKTCQLFKRMELMNNSNWSHSPNGLKPSRSDPALAPPPLYVAPTFGPAPVMKPKGQVVQSQQTSQSRINRQSLYTVTNGNSQTHVWPSTQTDSKAAAIRTTKTEQQSAVTSVANVSDLNLKEAVEFLSHADENYQQCGATFIQNITFKEDSAKQEVFQLRGIPLLVSLLRSSNPGVSQSAAGALRNLVFKDRNNKLEVQRCGGIAKALQLLKETDSTETQKQITGLLWNLSSADELKGELITTALPALTENVVVPFTCWSDSSVCNNIHPEVFYSATGCLRNLSCANKKEREAMRDCRGLIDSLMSYIQGCVAEDNPDDKSVENCACILHNLTYHLEEESPECFEKYNPQTKGQPDNKKNPPVGCFSPKSTKAQKQFAFDAIREIPEDGAPSGRKWLCHPKAMQTYLSLLSSSQKDSTLEACCGVLQNLTASKGLGSNVMSQILTQKLGALPCLVPLLQSHNPSLQKAAMSLVGNLSRSNSVQTSMAKQVLPSLTNLLSSGTKEMGKSDDSIANACNILRSLISADPEISKKVITKELVTSLAGLSENRSFPKGSKAASLLLHSLWTEKSLQGVLKKLGMGKSLFINDTTTAVHKSVQVIE